MSIKNINSKINIKRNIQSKIAERITLLGNIYSKITFYLVDEDTMDKISPPEKTYDEKCLKMMFEQYKNNLTQLILRELEKTQQTPSLFENCKTKTYVKLGVYCKNGAPFLDIYEPSIFICPERIYNKPDPDIIFQYVAIHELVHAYINKKYNDDSEKIIEESLSNAIAFLHFKDKEKENIIKFIKNQPIEYKGCYYWLKFNSESLYLALSTWKEDKFLKWFQNLIYYSTKYQPFYKLFLPHWDWLFSIIIPVWVYPWFFPLKNYPLSDMEKIFDQVKETNDVTPLLKLTSIEILKEVI